MANKQTIFKKGSTTYYYSSLFFPPDMRDEVFTLYAFVRTADDLVDAIPQKKKEFAAYRKETERAFGGKSGNGSKKSASSKNAPSNKIITDFVAMANRTGITLEEVSAFLDAMEADTFYKPYKTYKQLQNYMYGSASVIGIMMCKIMKLPKEAYTAAKLQGEAMQLINFIRDIQEDLDLGRIYLPLEDLSKFKLEPGFTANNVNIARFEELVRFEIDRYFKIQKEADAGFHFIPRKFRIPIRTAADMYNWTAQTIYANPMIVFEKKIKPKPARVILRFIINSIRP